MELSSLRRPVDPDPKELLRKVSPRVQAPESTQTHRRPDPKKNGSVKDPQWERYPRVVGWSTLAKSGGPRKVARGRNAVGQLTKSECFLRGSTLGWPSRTQGRPFA